MDCLLTQAHKQVRTVAIGQLDQLVRQSAAFEATLHNASLNFATLHSARRRRDAARAEDTSAKERCQEVEALLEKTTAALSRLRCATAAHSNLSLQAQVDALTRKFVLRFPFPRPGEWVRGTTAECTTSKIEGGVEVRSVSELVPHTDPTQALKVQRVYYSQGVAGEAAKHQEALRIVREMRHPDGFEDDERHQVGEDDRSHLAQLYPRAAEVNKEVVRIPAPKSLGKEKDTELLDYVLLSFPSLLNSTDSTPESKTASLPEQQQHRAREVPRYAQEILQRAIEGAMEERLNAWASSYRTLQHQLSSSEVPYSATWIPIKDGKVSKWKTAVAALEAKMLELPPSASTPARTRAARRSPRSW